MEVIVNEQIMNCLNVKVQNIPIEEAKKTGAAALFGEKWQHRPCGKHGRLFHRILRRHAWANTGVITAFKILSETQVSQQVFGGLAALTSKGLLKYYDEPEEKLHEAKLLKAAPMFRRRRSPSPGRK